MRRALVRYVPSLSWGGRDLVVLPRSTYRLLICLHTSTFLVYQSIPETQLHKKRTTVTDKRLSDASLLSRLAMLGRSVPRIRHVVRLRDQIDSAGRRLQEQHTY